MDSVVQVIGSGIAGGTAALVLADKGVPVLLLAASKSPGETASHQAQGGVVYRGDGDSAELLAEDIWNAGAGCGRRDMIELLARNSSKSVERILLQRLNVGFDRVPGGDFSLTREGAHSCPRIIHCRDATGRAIMEALHTELKAHPGITLLDGWTAVELLSSGGRCIGAEVINERGEHALIHAAATILATGGAGGLFERTSNPAGAKGQGAALAARAGATLRDMEYVQFHPTALAVPGADAFLISEAVRGAGARLVTADNRPFMQEYDPRWKDLAPRDIVTRAIRAEMDKANLSNVYLNFFDYIQPGQVPERFPTINKRCLEHGIDITQELLPIAPAAHFLCGGIAVDENAETTLPGLFALGECSCTGIHGANRLASTSLLEGVFWAELAAEKIASELKSSPPSGKTGFYKKAHQQASTPGGTMLQTGRRIETEIRGIMWEKIGIIRHPVTMKMALDELRDLKEEAEALYCRNSNSAMAAGLRNTAAAAVLIAEAASVNRVSRGCHFVVS